MIDDGDRSVNVGGDAMGNIIQTGDRNTAVLKPVTLPSPDTVDIRAELAALRQVLLKMDSPDQMKVDHALGDAEAELAKPEPDRQEVGGAVDRALKYAERASAFAAGIESLKPHVVSIAAWLGSNWDKILRVVGLTTG